MYKIKNVVLHGNVVVQLMKKKKLQLQGCVVSASPDGKNME